MVFFFTDPATAKISTLSLHDALPISARFVVASAANWSYQLVLPAHGVSDPGGSGGGLRAAPRRYRQRTVSAGGRSEEHTSELQSQSNLVCRLLLEKKNENRNMNPTAI